MNIYSLTLWLICWGMAVFFFHHYRLWLFYFITGAIGLALLIINTGRSVIPLELWLEYLAAYNVHDITRWFGIQTQIFSEAPGAILVLVIPQGQGWTLLEVGIECSGLLELSVLIGLLSFYPGWKLKSRLARIAFGIGATYIGNLVRILFIVITLAFLGKDTLFLSHTLIGRIIFFMFVILIYWIVLTWPTLKQLRTKLLTNHI